ncbi:hypothetical protein P3T23_000233 [Paraburkholderia sp. GAS448]|jgi:hypothetical protein|uniref:hypothetical protein n=1 Tax=Paraburkholderia sp. GAS448 TaxID=3035136 RepID=UPI003D1D6CD3
MPESGPDRTGSTGEPNHAFAIANEFTGVWVSKVRTAQGDRLELFVPSLGKRIQLDPMQLEAIVTLKAERFSEFLALVMERDGPD